MSKDAKLVKGPWPEVFAFAGACGLSVGVWLSFGAPAALIVLGSILLILGIVGALR